MSAIDDRDHRQRSGAPAKRFASLPSSNDRRRNENESTDPRSDTAILLTVRDAHRAVRDAKRGKCRHRRTRGRGISRRRARAADQWTHGESLRDLTAVRSVSARRRVFVLWVTAATLLCYVAVLVTFGSQTNQRLADIGGLLIVICGALCLNAETVAARTEMTDHRSEKAGD